MSREMPHESADLEDYEVLDSSDTLDGAPGDDPLDRGVVAPQHWSAGMRFGSTAREQRDGQSLDQLLTAEELEEEPDGEPDGGPDRGSGWDENATEDDIGRFSREPDPDERAGRLVAEDEGAHPDYEAELIARDPGIDGGGASAEEAAVHIVGE